MRQIADLHIHSKYSRACSANLTPSNIAVWCRAKGIDIVATGDYTHPGWLKMLQDRLVPDGEGLYRLRPEYEGEDGTGSYRPAPVAEGGRPVRFILSTEISCIYKKNDKTRRLHLVVLAPNLKAAATLGQRLADSGYNITSDGRPILGLDAKELLKLCLDCHPEFLVIPAHAWTPWYSVFGSQSGFDSLEECFEEMTPEIHAVETGLSSDPPMNWRLSGLDAVMLVSNSDAHGLANLGREANVFDLEDISYRGIADVLKNRNRQRFLYTIEFYPEEGKYHADGCRSCKFSCEPKETERLGGLCPKCGKKVTRGVLGRVHALADRKCGIRPPAAVPFRHIVPLEEMIAETLGRGKGTKGVIALYDRIIREVGPEFDVLLDSELSAVSAISPALAEAITRMRNGDISLNPGYDGVFGKVKIFSDRQKAENRQRQLL